MSLPNFIETALCGTPLIEPKIAQIISRFSVSSNNVLIIGEAGTKKKLVARSLHEQSSRKNKPFIMVNCAAYREVLLESELWGHEKGAFRGADTRKIGLAEIAHGGTLFLDEIQELPPGTQAKLLALLKEKSFFRVGGKTAIKIDIRLVSATEDLENAVNTSNFREDLYYLVNQLTIPLDPLRRRTEDIPQLVTYFLNQSKLPKVKDKSFSDEALKVLSTYLWPGNLQELENACISAQILSSTQVIEVSDLPDKITTSSDDPSVPYNPQVSLHDMEKIYIQKALKYFNGDKTQAAQALGLTIKTLYNRLHMYGMLD